ncbi:AraC family transcriptional regulator [Kordiimonas lacus]|uniref:Transcriptional regulator, AraC family n=1 Tax=Kordiimonas lacus TaxID=637679 RepID=A0A1G7CRF0_9PROT|nr:AraC family transcriptional regulator [Kordiimonas lacus]SDE41908.1 transcriptional regulator, AraC family [Kordiimonas lacus]
MDVLSDILDILKFKGSLYFTTDLTAPWGIEVPDYQNVARFHMAIGGDCWVRLAGQDKAIRLTAGDMILIPHGCRHYLLDKPESPVLTLDHVLAESGYSGDGYLVYGGNGDTYSKLVCGHFEYDESFSHPLVQELPDHILITGRQAMEFSWFDSAMKFMSFESQTSHLGNDAIVKRLAEILFIHSVRLWNSTSGRDSGFLAAIADRHLGRGIAKFHERPDERWTIERLAAEAGLSRSVFASQFRDMLGMTPMEYVTLWRMQKACRYLLESDMSTDAVAEQVGYQSLAAFSKVFKKVIGVGPGSYRREQGLMQAS